MKSRDDRGGSSLNDLSLAVGIGYDGKPFPPTKIYSEPDEVAALARTLVPQLLNTRGEERMNLVVGLRPTIENYKRIFAETAA